jgi:hypothetical protein
MANIERHRHRRWYHFGMRVSCDCATITPTQRERKRSSTHPKARESIEAPSRLAICEATRLKDAANMSGEASGLPSLLLLYGTPIGIAPPLKRSRSPTTKKVCKTSKPHNGFLFT